MSSEATEVRAGEREPSARLALGFALTIFTSAFLLFQIEPLISKVILPWFGGSPAVWTTCLLFFQTLLFVGYAYAHVSTRVCTRRQQAVLHLALVALALALMPVSPGAHAKPSGALHPTLGVLKLLAETVGLPYLLLSSTGPLVQGWFGQAYPGRAPYRLYALSNVGSLLALVSYPFVFEPAFTTGVQARLWSWGFVGYAGLLAYATSSRLRTPKDAKVSDRRARSIPVSSAPPSVGQRALWVGLPAFASVLLLATTNHVCENVAVIPFLWVAPLALYLLTFIIAFDGPRWYSRRGFAIAGLVLSLAVGCIDPLSELLERAGIHTGFRSLLVLDFSYLFVIAMLCHGELVRSKPSADRLTEFYLLVALGGALGGVFVSMACPALFSTFFEWTLGLLTAFALALAVRAVTAGDRVRTPLGNALLGVPLVVGLALIGYFQRDDEPPLEVARNFYGTIAVYDVDADKPADRHLSLTHGVVVHGRQYTAPDKQDQPLAYYGEESGVGRALRFFANASELSVGAVGLGVGTLAHYVHAPQHLQFYEINPEVVRLAEKYFTYLSRCGAACSIVMGDARLSLEREQPQNFHVLVLDAFSGDAVPTHLLTQQAFDLYLRHLRPEGVIAVNITNRQLDLAPVLEGLAEQAGLRRVRIFSDDNPARQLYHADWMLLTRDGRFVSATPARLPPNLLRAKPKVRWTDGYSNLFQLLK
ncbi:MAG TPA: fused MFS/spermidine synthase [Polyangiaceae bacterium]|nr:fused MFS/spermidine synthase [Polyangiaceae bacterium]